MTDQVYDVCEIFDSIQGEGPNMGMPSTFIRLQGCNLNCDWCDSKYSWKAYLGKGMMTVDDILKEVHYPHIVITGGEPLMQDLQPLLRGVWSYVPERSWNGVTPSIEIETNGTIFDDRFIGYAHYIISPKRDHENKNIMRVFSKLATFKFVVTDNFDIEWARDLTEKYGLKDVWLMPEGTDIDTLLHRLNYMVSYLLDNPWAVKISPRLQIFLYGNVRGK